MLASSNNSSLPLPGTVRQSMLQVSPAAISAAAGWLAGHALTILGDRSFLDRVVGALELEAITFDFLMKLDVDIRWTARQKRIALPELSEFMNPVNVLVYAPGHKAALEASAKVSAWTPVTHKFWRRAGSVGDICGLCGGPKFAHVEPTASVEGTISGEAKG